ncbi:hypothetical protein LTS07_001699 [Exophiala sideris]|uniref:Zn(2)-C6 fungal-type domain-containing protein n=1 Tax=Exophiala sideris TaxID=1016849 RepID=A0ABR0JPJ7_9EURO|nr:hypothetical protein LTS07_001699 [Exophiala sideris]KAK5044214.1 hypothetical protein LTR13_000570 [Exophiala sideris]KAK5067714.1 hypothetical protein LTR69_001703 [Exophiala sideris]
MSIATAPRSPKRRKIEVACEICRLRKSRCDGVRPKCGACLKRRNVGPFCVYSEQPQPNIFTLDSPRSGAPASVSNSQRALSLTGRSPGPQQEGPRGASTRKGVADDLAASDNDWILKAGLLAASSSSNFFHTVFGAPPVANKPSTPFDLKEPAAAEDQSDDSGSRIPSGTTKNLVHSADYVLPSRKVADHLIDLFFRHAYIQWLDRLKFMRWYDRLWTEGGTEVEDPVEEQIRYANLNIIFALVYRTERENIADNQDHLAQTHFLRANRLLQLSLLDLNRLDLLYTLLLLLQWFQSVNNVRRCTSLVALCVLIARNLGLHISGRIEALPNQYEREMARRAWHGCILMDRIIAMVSGQPMQISQDMARQTPWFEAVDDVYLSHNGANGVQPPGRPPMPSFFLAFCQLHLILGDVLVNSGRPEDRSRVDVNHIIQIDEDLERFAEALPAHLRIGQDHNQQYTGPIVHLHARFLHVRIMLYRAFFLQAADKMKRSPSAKYGFADAVIHQGLLACVHAAQDILELIGCRLLTDDLGPRLVPQWWHTVTYVYTAATIMIATHLFPKVVEDIGSENLAASIQQGLNILDHYSEHDAHKESARRCKTALEVLCERHIRNRPPIPTSNGTMMGQSATEAIDAGRITEDFGWGDFSTDSLGFFRDGGMESLLFSTTAFGEDMEVNEWL